MEEPKKITPGVTDYGTFKFLKAVDIKPPKSGAEPVSVPVGGYARAPAGAGSAPRRNEDTTRPTTGSAPNSTAIPRNSR